MGNLLPVALLVFIFSSAFFVNHGASISTNLTEWYQKIRHPNEKLTQLEFYANPQADLTVAANGTGAPPNLFGLIAVIDYRLTAGPNLTSSELVGRGQGFFTSSSMSDFSFFTAINIVFQTGKYKGSALTIVGYDPTGVDSRELTVVGGAGEFRMARGFAIFTSLSRNPTTNLTDVLRFSATVLHYCSPSLSVFYS